MQKKGVFIISVCIISIMVICAFLPALKNGFIEWDDPFYVTENSYISRISLANIKVLLTTAFVGTYQPVVNLTYLLERHFFGLNAAFYHATNLLLHLLNCLLVFYLVFLWDSNVFVALMSALLFGLHPLRVESVAWVSERKDVLYSFFFLWALVDYCRYIKNNAGKYYYRSFFLFLLALGSKAMAAILPLVFFAVDYLFKRKFDKKLILEKVPFFALSFLFGLIAIVAQGKALHLGHGEPFVLSLRLAAPLYGSIMYLWKTVFPVKLSLIYPYPPQNAGFYFICLLSIILISLICWAAVVSRRFTRKVVFSLLFSFITVLPVLQFIPVGIAIMADRYTYLPSIGICYIASVGFFYLYSMKHRYGLFLKVVLIVFFVGIVTALSFQTYGRTHVWKDSIAVFGDVIKNYPDAMVYNNRGMAYLKKGDLDQGISDCNKSIELDPKNADPYNNRGNAYRLKGDLDQAISDCSKAIELDPKHAAAYLNRGNAYTGKGDLDRAISDYSKVIELNPKHSKAYLNRGNAYLGKGDLDQGISDYNKVIEINPKFAEAYSNRGNAYIDKGNIDQGISDYNKAIEINPEYAGAHYNRAMAYFKKEQYGKSWEDLHRAQALGFSIDPEFIETLKNASGRDR